MIRSVVLIPAYNESDSIVNVIIEIKKLNLGLAIVVIDTSDRSKLVISLSAGSVLPRSHKLRVVPL